MVSDNQLDQYCQFVNDMLLKEVISGLLMHHAHSVNQNLPTIHGLDKVMQLRTWNQWDVAGHLFPVTPEKVTL